MARQLRQPFFCTPIQINIDHETYLVKEKVGNGSFGQVYTAHPINHANDIVAIKVVTSTIVISYHHSNA